MREENYSHSGSGLQPGGADAGQTNGRRGITATSRPRFPADHVPGPLPQARGRDGDAASGGAFLAERLGPQLQPPRHRPGGGGPK